MWDVRPDDKEITNAIFLSTYNDSWASRTGGKQAPEFLALQKRLVAVRKRDDLKQAGKRPTEASLRLVQLFARAAKANPGSAAVRRSARLGWAQTKAAGYKQPETRLARAFTVQNVAALLPTLVPAIESSVDGDDSPLNDIQDELWDACGGGKLINMSKRSPENRETVEKARRPDDLNQGDQAA